MPELPECETVVRDLRVAVAGLKIDNLVAVSEVDLSHLRSCARDRIIRDVSRRGKYIIFNLDDDSVIVSHMRMTGQWVYREDNLGVSNSHFRWGFSLKDPNTDEWAGFLSFIDIRKFGTIERAPTVDNYEPFSRLGVDGLELKHSEVVKDIIKRGKKSKRPIKNFILDQGIIAGVGNIYACLDPRSYIHMADGTKKSITKVVVGDKVWSRNPNTKLVEAKKVLAVRPIERNGRTLYCVKPIGSTGSVKCTEDHRIFTNLGWVEAQNLDPSMHRIAVPSEVPNHSLEQLILGTSLGDSTIGTSETGVRKSKCLRLYQGEAQLKYLEYKEKALQVFISSSIAKMKRKEVYRTPNEKGMYQISTRYRPYFYTLWEISKQKNGINIDILSKLDIEGFAYWYMDDGYSNIRPPRKTYANLCCEGRTFEEAELIRERLLELGYGSKVVKGNDGPVVRLWHEDTQRFLEDISPYVPEIMRYKLDGDRSPFKEPNFSYEAGFIFLPFTVSQYNFSIKTVWDLEVADNHNFISDNVLVHNCEALFYSGCNPTMPTYKADLKSICKSLYFVFCKAIYFRGTSISNYVDGSGIKGKYQNYLQVYGREKKPCFNCGTKIHKITLANRSTFFCPKCQPIAR